MIDFFYQGIFIIRTMKGGQYGYKTQAMVSQRR